MPMDESDMRWKSYELALERMDHESNRAWTRVSILLGAQGALLAVLLAESDRILQEPLFALVAFPFVILFSGLVLGLIVFQGKVGDAARHMAAKAEGAIPEERRLLRMAAETLPRAAWTWSNGLVKLMALTFLGLWVTLYASLLAWVL